MAINRIYPRPHKHTASDIAEGTLPASVLPSHHHPPADIDNLDDAIAAQIGALLIEGAGIDITHDSLTGATTIAATGGGSGLADGDYGDISVSGAGTVLGIDTAVLSPFGRTLTDDTSAGVARGTLGLPVTPQVTKVVRSTNLSVATTTWTTIGWDTEVFDDAGAHDNVTNNARLTVPSGYDRARITGFALWANNSTGGRRVSILRGGTEYITSDLRTALNETGQTADSGWITVTAGDYFEMQVNQTSGAALALQNTPSFGGRAWFQIELANAP